MDLNTLAVGAHPITVSITTTIHNEIVAPLNIGTLTINPLPTAQTPTASPVSGAVAPSTAVTLSSEAGAIIRYTIDGSTPTTSSPVYSSPITVNSAMTIKAIAVKAGMLDSAVMSESYTIASVSHTITVNAGTGGTATGDGSLAENTTATVVATAITGFRFKQWTENGTVVAGAGATYSFPVTAPRTLTAEFEPDGSVAATAPTINGTLGASGNGTVTGGGDYGENTTATVTATPNTGWHFVSWTENGAIVSTAASYSFTVTAPRTLTAEFAPNGSITNPPIVTSSGRSSSSGGTSKADVAPTAGTATTGKPLAKTDATKLFTTALAAKPEGATMLSIKAKNFTKVNKTVLAELAALAKKNGVTLTVHFDSVKGGKVTSRISINPALVTTNLDLTVKIVGNKITLPKFATPVEVAVKMPVGMTIETLKITQNGKDITATAKPWLDKNGYLHFTTTGGEIVLAVK